MTTRILPISSIHVDDTINISRGGQPIRESSSILALAEDIKQHGLIENVGVAHVTNALWLTDEERNRLHDNGKEYVLIYGFRRFKACSIIGFDTIRCQDVGKTTRAQAELENLAENCGREPPNDYDLTLAAHRVFKTHAQKATTIAQRLNKPVKWVEDSVAIVKLVSPNLLDHYRANCSVSVRRKMVLLSAIDGETDEIRYENQHAQWSQWETEEASAREVNPDADFTRRGPRRGDRDRHESNTPTRTQLVNAADRIIIAHEFYDGQQWRPITPDALAALRSLARWTLNPNETLPVR